MKFTKSVSAVLSCVMALSLTGCGSSSAASSSSTAAADKASGKPVEVIIGTSPDYPPYESLDNEDMVGFDIDMGNWLFDYLNKNGYNYKVTWSQMSFDTIISAIQADQVDLGISGFTYDKDRKVLFSDPYFDSAEVVLVNKNSDITTKDDLKGKKIGAQLGTTGETCANDIDGAQVQAIEDMGVAMASLKANSLDAVIMDEPVAKQYAATGDYKILDEKLLEEENYVIAKEGNIELMDAVNMAIKAFNDSDDKEKMVEKWSANTDSSSTAEATAAATGDAQ